MRVVLTEKFWEHMPEVDGTSLIITKFKGRWFTTVRSANGKQVHAASNHRELVDCICELSVADMSLKREVVPLGEPVSRGSTRKDIISDAQVNRAMKKMWESIKYAGNDGQPV
jgi:hypothetical protein